MKKFKGAMKMERSSFLKFLCGFAIFLAAGFILSWFQEEAHAKENFFIFINARNASNDAIGIEVFGARTYLGHRELISPHNIKLIGHFNDSNELPFAIKGTGIFGGECKVNVVENNFIKGCKNNEVEFLYAGSKENPVCFFHVRCEG